MKLQKTMTALVLIFVMMISVVSPVLAMVVHTVSKGESLFIISGKYGTTIPALRTLNGLQSEVIIPGQQLKIDATIYTVEKGDTLTGIANKTGTSVLELKKTNSLSSDVIYPGQKLRVSPGSVSSRGLSSYTNDDLYWLAKAVYGEARGESYQGQVAVAAVIVNRVRDGDFPNTIREVIFEPLAFTCVADRQIYLEPDATAIKAARGALAGEDPSGGALYYWNPVKATSKWVWTRQVIKSIGNHVFAI